MSYYAKQIKSLIPTVALVALRFDCLARARLSSEVIGFCLEFPSIWIFCIFFNNFKYLKHLSSVINCQAESYHRISIPKNGCCLSQMKDAAHEVIKVIHNSSIVISSRRNRFECFIKKPASQARLQRACVISRTSARNYRSDVIFRF